MTDFRVTSITLDLHAVFFGPIDLEFLAAPPAFERARHFLRREGSASPTVGAHGIRATEVWRRFAMGFFRRGYDAPAERRPLLNFEPCPQHADFAAVDLDNCLEVIEFEDAVPGASTELQRDIGLQTSEQKGHHGS